MATPTNLDMDVLRSFATGFELGSFARAADRLGRSQSAISSQLRKLEAQVGQRLVRKSGRSLVLTPAGESLLSFARRILDLNDTALAALAAGAVGGTVRLGLPQDFAEAWLPGVLGRFGRAHPDMQVELRAERNARLITRIAEATLDLALVWGDASGAAAGEHLADLPIRWIGPRGWSRSPGAPLALALFEAPCAFRSAALAALDQAGIGWRLACTSPSLAGLWAAAEAGLGITARTAIGLPGSLAVLDPAVAGLPALPSIGLSLHCAERRPAAAVAALANLLRAAVAAVPIR